MENDLHSMPIPLELFQHTTRKFICIFKLISTITYNTCILRHYYQYFGVYAQHNVQLCFNQENTDDDDDDDGING
jgi:hypothetical protein